MSEPIGWWVKYSNDQVTESLPVLDREEWNRLGRGREELIPLAGLADGGRPAPNGDRLVSLPFRWGWAPAEHFAVFSPEGEMKREVSGVNDHAPEPFIGHDGGWDFTDRLTRNSEEAWEEERAFRAFRSAAEQMAGGGVAAHLRASYRIGANPLPGLRKRFGGKWEFHRHPRPPGTPPSRPPVVLFTDDETSPSWWVEHTPAR